MQNKLEDSSNHLSSIFSCCACDEVQASGCPLFSHLKTAFPPHDPKIQTNPKVIFIFFPFFIENLYFFRRLSPIQPSSQAPRQFSFKKWILGGISEGISPGMRLACIYSPQSYFSRGKRPFSSSFYQRYLSACFNFALKNFFNFLTRQLWSW